MIQETHKLTVPPGGDYSAINEELAALLIKVRDSDAYQRAKCVYVQLLAGNVSVPQIKNSFDKVREILPTAQVGGMATTVNLYEKDDVYLKVSVCYFERSQVQILTYNGDSTQFLNDGRKIGHEIAQTPFVKGVEMFCVVINLDIAPFITGISEENANVPFFGSLAGMSNPRTEDLSVDEIFDQEAINVVLSKERNFDCFIIGNEVLENGIVMAVFSGEDLHMEVDPLLGWKPLGKEMTVTKSVSTVCTATIDGIPATEIYRKYLHVLPDNRFLLNICEFPMIIERDGFLIARTPPVFDEKGRLYFIGDVHEGEKIRLSYANQQEVLQKVHATAAKMEAFCPEGIFLIICPNRPVFLGHYACEEPASYERINPMTLVSYGPGEVYRFNGKGGVLNSMIIAAGFREGAANVPPNATDGSEYEDETPRAIPLASRLAAFLDATTHELMEMADAAEAANEAKSNFLSNIRTPVNAILGMDEMILREATEETVLEYADNIRLAGSNLLGLINDILDFSKIESGKMDIIPVEYAISSVINDLVNMTQSRAEKKQLSFAVSASPDLPTTLYGDEIRIKQVITNILTNAVKYTERGFVALSVTYEKKGEDTILLRVRVQDSGIGIKEEDLKKLFTAFTRIEEKRNRTIEGTGLGMNITRRLLSLMDSELKVESIYGKGSTFSFVLEQKVVDWTPMGNFEDAHHSAFNQRNEYRRSFTAPDAQVLVVDDTPMNLTVFKGLLKQTKVQIDTAESGFACLDAVQKKKYDIIFLDHRMPKLDGIETLARMKTLPGNKNEETPVISLTANAISGAREKYLAAGFKDYLTKPINGQQLENMLLKYLPPKLTVLWEDEVFGGDGKKEKAVVPEWLKDVTGIDIKEGIKNCGSAEAFMDALTIFAESVVPGSKEIARYYETENWKDFTVKVHALKSTARIIGAKELSERAKYLEYAGNHSYIDEIKYCSDDLLQLYLAYAFKLAPLTKKRTEEDERPLIDGAALTEAYETMRDIALSFDYDSMLMVMDSLEQYRLPPAETARYESLLTAIKKPDWNMVNELLKEICG